MKACFGLMVFMLCLAWSMPVFAEQVSHHGTTAEVNGKAVICISCHDGSLAHVVSYCTVKCDFSTSHAILKRYPPPGKERDYAPAGVLAAEGIKLERDQVTCISCHDLKNPGENHLVRAKSGKNLCRICHVRQ